MINKMKAWMCYAPNIIEPETVDVPQPADDEALVEILACGICYTEYHSYMGVPGLLGSTGAPLNVRAPVGYTPGHESCGRIVEVGKNVRNFKIGDRVVLSPGPTCGDGCIVCKSGINNNCIGDGATASFGHFAEFAIAKERNMYKIPDGVGDFEGAAMESLVEGVRGVRKYSRLGDNTVFFGMEDYNMGAYEMIKNTCTNLIVVETLTNRREWLKRIGVKHIVNPDKTDPLEYIDNLMPFGADVIYVAADAALYPTTRKYLSWAYETARVGGRICIMRPYGDDFWHNSAVNIGWIKEVNLQFVVGWGDEAWLGGRERGDMNVLAQWISDGRIRADSHFTKVVDFKDINTKADVDKLFGMYLDKEVKIAVRISSVQKPKYV
ncbi:MAG: alcohol dehydrogenase catalytic domain-containing protein [Synergistaceae bacterium]|nr:alcohol dehydrogenase catalytic domain-containing protein [Synergistaceae bacterium]